MSAWLCSQNHINLIVNASSDPDERWFKKLLAENLRSLRHRYPGREFLKDWEIAAEDYVFERISPEELIKRVYAEQKDCAPHYPAVTAEVTPERIKAQVRQSCDCFDYQSCENEDYYDTDIALFVAQVRAANDAPAELQRQALWSF